MSHGQRTLTALAFALAHHAEILLLDEPNDGLVKAPMQFVITSANFHAIPGLRRGLSDRQRSVVRERCFSRTKGGDSGWAYGARPCAVRPSRIIQGSGLKFGRGALGHGDWEKSVAKRVGQTGDKTSWPKPLDPLVPTFGTIYFQMA